MVSMSIKIAHFSDTHLGYESYQALSSNGNNQRGEDIVRAVQRVAKDIAVWDPDLVIHSGDVLEKPKTDIRYMHFALTQFKNLTSRQDGSKRPVVILAGNHELSRSRQEVCWLELLSSMPDIYVVTRNYSRVIFDESRYPGSYLSDVVVHAIPHDDLKTLQEDEVYPIQGKVNILSAHGVAGGSELFYRALGREFAIPKTILERQWDYGALGHWHKRGPITLEGTELSNIWYAGSTENMGFRDLRDNGENRGYLRVELDEKNLKVKPIDMPVRSMFRLPVIDAAKKTADEITEEMLVNISSADITDSVVGQIVENVPRELWGLVDMARVRKTAQSALHFEVTPRHLQVAGEVTVRGGNDPVDFLKAAESRLDIVPEAYKEPVKAKVVSLIKKQASIVEETK